MAHGKKYLDAAKLVDRARAYPPDEAAQLVKDTTTVSFDASIEAHLRLGVDPRHADQMVRGTVVLPHGTGKIVRVAVLRRGTRRRRRCGRRRGRRGGPGQEDRGRLARVRRRARDPGQHGHGRAARQDPRSPRTCPTPRPVRSPSTWSARSRKSKSGRVEFKVDKADRPRAGRQEQLRGRGDRREPGDARRRDQLCAPFGRRRASTSRR